MRSINPLKSFKITIKKNIFKQQSCIKNCHCIFKNGKKHWKVSLLKFKLLLFNSIQIFPKMFPQEVQAGQTEIILTTNERPDI